MERGEEIKKILTRKNVILLLVAALVVGFLGYESPAIASMEGNTDRGYNMGDTNYNKPSDFHITDQQGTTWDQQQKLITESQKIGGLPNMDIRAIFQMGKYSFAFPVYGGGGGGSTRRVIIGPGGTPDDDTGGGGESSVGGILDLLSSFLLWLWSLIIGPQYAYYRA